MILIGGGDHAADIAYDLSIGAVNRVDHHSLWDGRVPVIIGINNPTLRAKVAAELGIDDALWVHRGAHVGHGCTFGVGVHVNYNSSMVRTKIGDHTTVSPGVTICGGVRIGNRVLLGAGSVVCDKATIGDDVIIGAGSVVLPHQTINEGTWVGSPARRIK